MLARNFESTLLDAYGWLSETYKKGDRIFLFGIVTKPRFESVQSLIEHTGFSRGAYQVRTLSAMIDKVILVTLCNECCSSLLLTRSFHRLD